MSALEGLRQEQNQPLPSGADCSRMIFAGCPPFAVHPPFRTIAPNGHTDDCICITPFAGTVKASVTSVIRLLRGGSDAGQLQMGASAASTLRGESLPQESTRMTPVTMPIPIIHTEDTRRIYILELEYSRQGGLVSGPRDAYISLSWSIHGKADSSADHWARSLFKRPGNCPLRGSDMEAENEYAMLILLLNWYCILVSTRYLCRLPNRVQK